MLITEFELNTSQNLQRTSSKWDRQSGYPFNALFRNKKELFTIPSKSLLTSSSSDATSESLGNARKMKRGKFYLTNAMDKVPNHGSLDRLLIALSSKIGSLHSWWVADAQQELLVCRICRHFKPRKERPGMRHRVRFQGLHLISACLKSEKSLPQPSTLNPQPYVELVSVFSHTSLW